MGAAAAEVRLRALGKAGVGAWHAACGRDAVLQTIYPQAVCIEELPTVSWPSPCFLWRPCPSPHPLQVNNTIAELEGLRRRLEADEVATEEASKAGAVARGQARKMRWVLGRGERGLPGCSARVASQPARACRWRYPSSTSRNREHVEHPARWTAGPADRLRSRSEACTRRAAAAGVARGWTSCRLAPASAIPAALLPPRAAHCAAWRRAGACFTSRRPARHWLCCLGC
mgnify:CR=1 FL=1